MYEKLILLTASQREQLEDIQKNVKENGGNVSANQLIRDGIQIFIENYQEAAIRKYSSFYD
jgi:predicted lactoylglutathione lyase